MQSKAISTIDPASQLFPIEQNEQDEQDQKEKNERLVFACAIEDYGKKNAEDVINIILSNAFQFLPIKDIKKVRLTCQNAYMLITELLRESIHAIVIGSRPEHFPIKNNDRFFFLRFSHIPKVETEEIKILERMCFINSMTLNTYMLFFDIDMKRFSKKSLNDMIKACAQPEILEKLNDIHCVISRIKNKKTTVLQYLDEILKIESPNKKAINFDFSFNDKDHWRDYPNIKEDKKEINKKLEDFYNENKNNILKKINLNCLHSIPTISSSIEKYNQSLQKGQKTIKIELDAEDCKSEDMLLLKNIFNNTKFFDIKKVQITTWNEDHITSTIDRFSDEYSIKKNKSISTLKINHALFHRLSLEFFLKKLKNLKQLVLNNCYVDECFYDFTLEKDCALEKIVTTWNDEGYTDDDEQPTIFFSVNSLKSLISHCPKLRYISLETLQLDECGGLLDDFLSYVKELSSRLDYMYFDLIVSDDTVTYMEEKPEEFAKKIEDLKDFLKSKNFSVEITQREDYGCSEIEFSYPLCIKIVKNTTN